MTIGITVVAALQLGCLPNWAAMTWKPRVEPHARHQEDYQLVGGTIEFDVHVLAVNIAWLAQFVAKLRAGAFKINDQKHTNPRNFRLLRGDGQRRDKQCDHSSDEAASSHYSIMRLGLLNVRA